MWLIILPLIPAHLPSRSDVEMCAAIKLTLGMHVCITANDGKRFYGRFIMDDSAIASADEIDFAQVWRPDTDILRHFQATWLGTHHDDNGINAEWLQHSQLQVRVN